MTAEQPFIFQLDGGYASGAKKLREVLIRAIVSAFAGSIRFWGVPSLAKDVKQVLN